MGMDPVTIGLIASMVGGQLLGALTAPEGQELKSFEGDPKLDPKVMLGQSKDMILAYLQALTQRAGQPSSVNTTVQGLPSFSGGSLPIPIGVSGIDPAVATRGISSPGMDLSALMKVLENATAPRTAVDRDPNNPGVVPPYTPDRVMNDRQATTRAPVPPKSGGILRTIASRAAAGSGPQRRTLPSDRSATDRSALTQTSDYDQAEAALELLMGNQGAQGSTYGTPRSRYA